MAVIEGILSGDPQVESIGLVAGGLLAIRRGTRTVGAVLGAGCALLLGGSGGGAVAAAGLAMAIAQVMRRPGLGVRGVQLTLILTLGMAVVGLAGGDWSYGPGVLLTGALFARTRIFSFWILVAGGVLGWALGVANLDIFCGPALAASWMRLDERAEIRTATRHLPVQCGKILNFLWKPSGGWRTHLVVGAMGWAMYQNWLILAGKNTMWEYAVAAGPACVTILYCLGVMSIFLGCRPGLMLVMAGVGLWHLLESWVDAHPQLNFTGEEYLVWFIFPSGMFALSILGRGLPKTSMDNLTGMFCRVALFGSLGFAVLAKLNSDFFNPEVSCMILAEDIPNWWKVPSGMFSIHPGLFISLEAAPLFLSLFSGPLSILSTLGFAQGLAAIGPLGINACIIALTLGMLRGGDEVAIWNYRKAIFIGVLAFILFGLPFSQVLYQGPRHWYQFAVFHTVCVSIAGAVLAVLAGRAAQASSMWRRSGWRGVFSGWTEGWGRDLVGVWGGGRTIFLVITAMLLTFNGLCPYLGIKFRCSFSMLANLRVDHDRWNHFFMPKGLLTTTHDDYVRVVSAMDGHFVHPNLARRKRLSEGLMYSPEYFAKACRARLADKQKTQLVIRWRGAEGRLDSEDLENFHSFIEGLPKRNQWGDPGLQEVLSFGDIPQRCTH